MEGDIIQEWAKKRKIRLKKETAKSLLLFSRLIHEANQNFNLTGFKTQEAILSELIIESIDPLRDIIVPRGTRFVDLGSGAGIPGIVIAIYFHNLSGLLIESSQKKADFIKSAIYSLGLSQVDVLCERAEIAARNEKYNQSFSWCFSRAFGKIYITMELGAPFLKKNGFLYIYSNASIGKLPGKIIGYANKLGLRLMSHKENDDIGLSGGLCFKKEGETPEKYPRRFAVIKREAGKSE